MGHKREHILGRHSAYLTENMSMLLILLIIVVMVLSSFMKAQSLKKQGREQLMANITAQNFIEYSKATQVRYDDLLMNLRAQKINDKYYFYYNHKWEQTQELWQCAYVAEVIITEEQLMGGTLKNIQVNVYRREYEKDNMIYSLSAKVY